MSREPCPWPKHRMPGSVLALGAGAIAQVIVQISKGMAADRPLADSLRSGPVMAGLLAGFALMYTTGILTQ